jgi:hypothetical protein
LLPQELAILGHKPKLFLSGALFPLQSEEQELAIAFGPYPSQLGRNWQVEDLLQFLGNPVQAPKNQLFTFLRAGGRRGGLAQS